MKSLNTVESNIMEIEKLFPNVITEAKKCGGGVKKVIDFEKLKKILSDEISEDKE